VYHDCLAASHVENRTVQRRRRRLRGERAGRARDVDRVLAACSPVHRLRDTAHNATNPRLTTAAVPHSSINIALSR